MKPRSKRNRKRPRSELHDVGTIEYKTNVCKLELDGMEVQSSAGWLRTVEPYPYTFSTFAKARWIGRTVLDVYHTEFGSYPKTYYESAIRQGRILVSDKKVDMTYTIKGGDILTHTVHRHEPGVAVYTKESPYVNIVTETDDVVVVDKPGTLPIHPCGGYHVQSLMNMLEPKYGKLYTIHRLDRLTSGLVILGKTSKVAQEWGKSIMNRDCQKIYLARVRGKFPLDCPTELRIQPRKGPNIYDDDDNDYVLPINGEWVDSNSTSSTTTPTPTPSEVKSKLTNETVQTLKERYAHGYWITNSSNQVQCDATLSDVFESQYTVDEWLQNLSIDPSMNSHNAAGDDDDDDDKNDKNNNKKNNDNKSMLWFNLCCPTRVAQPKDGICEAGKFDVRNTNNNNIATTTKTDDNDNDDNHDNTNNDTNTNNVIYLDNDEIYKKTVKSAQTSFGVIKYDEESNSTIVICHPRTGRTHQIRLHLQHMYHSIANDLNYGGIIWYNNPIGQQICTMAQSRLNEMNEVNSDEIQRVTNGNAIDNDGVGNAKKVPASTEHEEKDHNATASSTPSCTKITTTAASAAAASDTGTGPPMATATTRTTATLDTPATEEEITKEMSLAVPQGKNESIHEFIQRTCVWCARSRRRRRRRHGDRDRGDNGDDSSSTDMTSVVGQADIMDRTKLEFLIRSSGIWLHALQYTFFTSPGTTSATTTSSSQGNKKNKNNDDNNNDDDDVNKNDDNNINNNDDDDDKNNNNRSMISFRAPLPSWHTF